MKKLKLDTVAVESFATMPDSGGETRGTLYGHAGDDTQVTRSCPTNFCVTIPVTCATFQPTCVQ
jgi:hypothetical protein